MSEVVTIRTIRVAIGRALAGTIPVHPAAQMKRVTF
jgi:hypothetical protein